MTLCYHPLQAGGQDRMFAQRVQAPQRKASPPAKESSKSESANIEAAPETVLASAPAYSYSFAGMPIVPPPNPPSDPPPAKPAPLPNSLPSSLAIGSGGCPSDRQDARGARKVCKQAQ